MSKKSFAGRIGPKARDKDPEKNLAVDLNTIEKKVSETTPAKEQPVEQPKRPRGGTKSIQADRIGKQSLNIYLDKNAKKQFAMLGIELEKNQTELVIEALNDLFKKYGKPPIA